MRSFLIAGSVVTVAAGSVMADTLVVPNPTDWANAQENEQPVAGDPTTGTVGGDSWSSVPSNNKGNEHHLLYFQGNLDSSDPQDADPNGYGNPKLFFQDGDYTDTPTIGGINRLSWDTNKSKESDAGDHWYGTIYTDNDDRNPQPDEYYDYQITFALTESKNYGEDSWNTLEADQNDSESIGGDGDGNLEVAVFDQRRVGGDNSTYPAKTFSDWADGEKPDWWDAEVLYGAIGTSQNHNNSDNKFISNLDNVNASFQTGSGVESRQLDLSPVPLPASAWMGLSLLGLVGGGAALRRYKAARDMA